MVREWFVVAEAATSCPLRMCLCPSRHHLFSEGTFLFLLLRVHKMQRLRSLLLVCACRARVDARGGDGGGV